jgi:hypothetical protein
MEAEQASDSRWTLPTKPASSLSEARTGGGFGRLVVVVGREEGGVTSSRRRRRRAWATP